MDLSGLQDQLNIALAITATLLIIGGIIAILKGTNISKVLGIVGGCLLLVGAWAIVMNYQTIGPAVAGLFT